MVTIAPAAHSAFGVQADRFAIPKRGEPRVAVGCVAGS